MKVFFSGILFFVFLFISNGICQKSNVDKGSNYAILKTVENLTPSDYTHLLDSLKRTGSTNYLKLRLAFTTTKNYNPLSNAYETSIKEAFQYYTIGNYKEAIKVLDELLKTNYVNIQAHLALSNIYQKLKDSVNFKMHHNIYSNLLKSIIASGNGQSAKTAFIVINVEEESSLLKSFNWQVKGQNPTSFDGYKFDILTVLNKKDGKDYNIFFNIDLLLGAAKKMAGSKEEIKEFNQGK